MVNKANSSVSANLPVHERIAHNLRLLRAFQQLSQKQLAEAANMSRSCYAALENGSRQADVNTILLLSDFYGISTDRLLKEDLGALYHSLLQEETAHHRR